MSYHHNTLSSPASYTFSSTSSSSKLTSSQLVTPPKSREFKRRRLLLECDGEKNVDDVPSSSNNNSPQPEQQLQSSTIIKRRQHQHQHQHQQQYQQNSLAKRALDYDVSNEYDDDDSSALIATQPICYTQDDEGDISILYDNEEEAENSKSIPFFLYDEDSKETKQLINGDDKDNDDDNKQQQQLIFRIGRHPSCHIQSEHDIVGRNHAKLIYNKITKSFILMTSERNSCWILSDNDNTRSCRQQQQQQKWSKVQPGKNKVQIKIGDTFRLIPSSSSSSKCTVGNSSYGSTPHSGSSVIPPRVGVMFTLGHVQHNKSMSYYVGSESFDKEYIKLLHLIHSDGIKQHNKKGYNWTIRQQHTLQINLQSINNYKDNNIIPLTTLRKMFQGRAAVIEALWYLRGENHVRFLQEHHQKFWDQQARDDGWVGLNYGMLTNYPSSSSSSQKHNGENRGNKTTRMINQLEIKVLKPLCEGKSSRNMLCTLCKPGEETVQEACTANVQFAVSKSSSGNDDDHEYLDLTVNQRSSDVILGLPHDVVVWTIILHLVRREVKRRCNRNLKAGQLYFTIAGGGAHVYDQNKSVLEELLERKPITGVNPILTINSDKDIFTLASTYEKNGPDRLLVSGYDAGKYHPAIQITQAV